MIDETAWVGGVDIEALERDLNEARDRIQAELDHSRTLEQEVGASIDADPTPNPCHYTDDQLHSAPHLFSD